MCRLFDFTSDADPTGNVQQDVRTQIKSLERIENQDRHRITCTLWINIDRVGPDEHSHFAPTPVVIEYDAQERKGTVNAKTRIAASVVRARGTIESERITEGDAPFCDTCGHATIRFDASWKRSNRGDSPDAE